MRRTTVLILAPSLVAAALAGCARTETPEQARQAARAAQEEYDRLAAAARAQNAGEEDIVSGASPGQINTQGALTPGSWSVADVDGERTARFGEEGETPRLTVSCEVGGGIDIRIPGMAPQGGSSTVYISSPSGGSTFTASDTIADEPEAYISVPADDPFIGRLISGNGPFSLRLGTDARLTFPADDVLTSVVSACDRRDTSEDQAEIDTETGEAAE